LEDLEGSIQDTPLGEKIFLGGNLNGHVGSGSRSFESFQGRYGFGGDKCGG